MISTKRLAWTSGLVLIASFLLAAPSQASSPRALQDLSPYDTAVLADDPTIYWTMGSAVTGAEPDLGDAGITGTYGGAPTTTTLPNGDSATQFDGATQYFEAADADALSPTTTGEITIEAWLRPDTLQFTNSQSSGYVNWMGKGEDQQHEYLGRMYSYDNAENRPNRISGYSFNTTGGLGAGSYFQDPVSVGEWIHFALVINTNDKGGEFPNGYTKVYKNGVLRDQDDLSIRGVTIIPERSTAPFRAGTRDFASWFEGAIGKIAIYDTELTPEQLTAHTEAMSIPAAASVALSSRVNWVDRNRNGKADASDASRVRYSVTNSGYRTLTDIAIESSRFGGPIDCDIERLEPGATADCAPVVRKLTGREVAARTLSDRSIVTASGGTETVSAEASASISLPR